MMLGSTIIESPHSTTQTTPALLGLTGYTEIKGIFVGDCGSTDLHYLADFKRTLLGGGHTHSCPYDPIHNHICVSDINELLDDDTTASPLLIHEYAHVLRGFPQRYLDYNWRCVGPNSLHCWDIDEKIAPPDLKNFDAHDAEWEKVMIELGQEPTRWVRPSNKSRYAQAAAVIR